MAQESEGGEDTALAKPAGTAVDRYEREFMAGDGAVLYRAKARAHWSLAAMILGTGTLVAAGNVLIAPVATVAMMAILFLTWLLFAVLRVTVSEQAVNIQLGLWGPKIPISSIISAQATTYKFGHFRGWGIRYSLSAGTMYNMPGDGWNALKIRWRSESGKEKTTWVGTREAEQLASTIRRAQAQALGAGSNHAELPEADSAVESSADRPDAHGDD